MKIANQDIHNEYVVLDFNDFTGCNFRDCTLVYHGHGTVGLDNCTFERCAWTFSGPAGNVVQFMTEIYHGVDGVKDIIEETFKNIRKGEHPNKPNE